MIASQFFKNPRLLIIVIIFLIAAGLSSYESLPRLEDPVLRQRIGLVEIVYPGAALNAVETDVSIPLQTSLNRIASIERMKTTSRDGLSLCVVQLKDSINDVDEAWKHVGEELKEFQQSLPESAQEPKLTIFPLKAHAAIVAVTFDAESLLPAQRHRLKEFQQNLMAIDGTESVEAFGLRKQDLLVEISPQTMQQTGITPGMLSSQLQQILITQPLGALHQQEAEVPVSLRQQNHQIDELLQIPVSTPLGEVQPLSQVASIRSVLSTDVQQLAITSGKKAVFFAIHVDNQIRLDRWAKAFEQTVAASTQSLEDPGSVEIIFQQYVYVSSRLKQLLINLGLSTLSVIGVIIVMMGWKSALIVGSALPLSAMSVVIGFHVLKIPIHQISVTGLVLALGLLIDNAIVMVEECRKKLLGGQTPQFAIEGALLHLTMPLLGSTATTILAFLPIALLSGPSGEFVSTLGISVILAVCSSLLLSVTLIPALTSLCYSATSKHDTAIAPGALHKVYLKSLRYCYRSPVLGLVLSLTLPAAGYVIAFQLPAQFFPASDRNQIHLEVELNKQSTLLQTEQFVRQVDAWIEDHTLLSDRHWMIGQSAPMFYYNVITRKKQTPQFAHSWMNVPDTEQVDELVAQMQSNLTAQFPDAKIIVRMLNQGPPVNAPVEMTLTGPDWVRLVELSKQIQDLLNDIPGIAFTRTDHQSDQTRLVIKPDTKAILELGLQQSDLNRFVYSCLEGLESGTILQHSESTKVRVGLEGASSDTLDQFRDLPFPLVRQRPPASQNTPPSVQTIPLSELYDFESQQGTANRIMVNGKYTITLEGYLPVGLLADPVVDEFETRLKASAIDFPAGYELTLEGERQARSHAIHDLTTNVILWVCLAVFVLMISFSSFRCMLIIFSVAGLALGLGPGSLALFGFPLGFMAILGTLGLMGVAVNDAIVVLAGIRANPDARQGQVEALADVVDDSTRHVLSTTLTTMVGFLPLLIWGGEFWAPLAIVLSSGVFGATLLALYYVPAAYRLLFWKRSTPVLNAVINGET